MNKYLSYLMIMFGCSGCSVVSKQYYYVPDAAHLTTNDRRTYAKMLYYHVEMADSSGKDIGSITTSNGAGLPLFLGPSYLPVLPVGIVVLFSKKLRQFQMDITIHCDNGYFMTLAIDSNNCKRIGDSLAALRICTAADLHTTGCYMIINDSTKVPLRVSEYFMGQTNAHSYRMSAPVGFRKVRTMTIVTGNAQLDRCLKNIIFRQNKRVTYAGFWLI
jgi:hypothetical protein